MSHTDLPEELEQTAQRLRSERPEIDSHSLDRVRRRIADRAARPVQRSRQSLAITLCLAFGLIFSGAGTGLAISGLATDGSATSAQYVGGTQTTGTETVPPTLGGDGEVDAATASGDSGDQAVAVGSSGKLPFTGSASLLILGLGGVLLVSGAVMRRRTSRGHDG